jgi:hypothetical protein
MSIAQSPPVWIFVMRLALVLLAAFCLTAPALAQSRDACEMVPADQLTALLGTAPKIGEQSGAGTGMSLCSWKSEEGPMIRLTSITAASQKIVGGTPLQYFEQHATDQKARFPEIIHDLEGSWQAGFIWDIVEDNPQQAVTITFLNKDDTVTLETFQLGRDASIGLAEAIAAAM